MILKDEPSGEYSDRVLNEQAWSCRSTPPPTGRRGRCPVAAATGRRTRAAPACPPRGDPAADNLNGTCGRFAGAVADGGVDPCILGLGGNGHLGLKEPGFDAEAPTRRVDLAAETVAAACRYGGGEPATGAAARRHS